MAATPIPGFTTMTGYLYDADGTRVAKGTITAWSYDPAVSGFKTTNDYVLGPSGEQAAEMGVGDAAAGSSSATALVWQHTNVWADGQLIATYDGSAGAQSGNSTYGLHFYFNDPLGTRRAQTDYAGVLEQTCQSLPFGDGLSCTGSTIYPTEHHFTGKERDAESGNDYFGARYYSSAMGRFMSPDWGAKEEPVPYAQLDDPQSLNLYSYVRNNPLTREDADGHDPGELVQMLDQSGFEPFMLAGGVLAAAATAWDHREDIAEQFNNTMEAIGRTGGLNGQYGDFSAQAPTNALQSKNATAPTADSEAKPQGPVKAADAPTVTAGGQAANEHGQKLGPSGKPQVNNVNKGTREGAKNAANKGSGTTEHTTPNRGKPHFHTNRGDGTKKRDNTHYNY